MPRLVSSRRGGRGLQLNALNKRAPEPGAAEHKRRGWRDVPAHPAPEPGSGTGRLTRHQSPWAALGDQVECHCFSQPYSRWGLLAWYLRNKKACTFFPVVAHCISVGPLDEREATGQIPSARSLLPRWLPTPTAPLLLSIHGAPTCHGPASARGPCMRDLAEPPRGAQSRGETKCLLSSGFLFNRIDFSYGGRPISRSDTPPLCLRSLKK